MKPKFKGRWKLYLNDDTPEKLAERNEFYGDWKHRKQEIFCKPRKFKAVIYPVTHDGNRLDELSLNLKNTIDYAQLSQIIFKFAQEYFEELYEQDNNVNIDTKQSYAVIRA